MSRHILLAIGTWMILGTSLAIGEPPSAHSPTGAAGEPLIPPTDMAAAKEFWAQRNGWDDWQPGPESDPDSSGYDAIHVDMTFEALIDSAIMVGEVVWTLRITDEPPTAIVFDLFDHLEITAAQIDGSDVTYTQQNDRLELKPAVPFAPGDLVQALVGYRGPPMAGFMRGLTFAHHNGVPMVYTQSEPIASRTWWPSKDRPDDKFTADLGFIVPDTLIVGSNGTLIEVRPLAGGRMLYRWNEQYPISTYLVSFAATNYETFYDTYIGLDGTEMPLTYYAYPEDLDRAMQDWAFIPQAITLFAEIFGEYPFIEEKYGMAEYEWGGAMEHQTLTSMGDYFLHQPEPQDWVVVHELAHQWWGDWVTCGTWRDIWLNEGFAVYCEALWAEHLAGPDSLRAVMLRQKRTYYPGTVYDPDFVFNSTVYRKGAWVLHMLRRVVGDPVFFSALRTYGEEHAYDCAVTADLQRTFEEASGQNLNWFFDEWVYHGGRPDYGVWWEPVVHHPSGATITEIRIVQETNAPDYFKMPLDARLLLESGAEFWTVLWDSLPEQTFLVETESPPHSVEVDPHDWVLCEVYYNAWPSAVADRDGATTSASASVIRLAPPRPNPSLAGVEIPFQFESDVGGRSVLATITPRVVILDAAGRVIRNLPLLSRVQEDTVGSLFWDGTNEEGSRVSPGVYFATPRGLKNHVSGGAVRILLVR